MFVTLQHGARTIYDTDDDNVILGDDVYELPECVDLNVSQSKFRTINPHIFWGDAQVCLRIVRPHQSTYELPRREALSLCALPPPCSNLISSALPTRHAYRGCQARWQ